MITGALMLPDLIVSIYSLGIGPDLSVPFGSISGVGPSGPDPVLPARLAPGVTSPFDYDRFVLELIIIAGVSAICGVCLACYACWPS